LGNGIVASQSLGPDVRERLQALASVEMKNR
jgi:hypothetical protein